MRVTRECKASQEGAMIATASEIRSVAAAIEGGDGVFCRYRTELEWLALFVTADETVAEDRMQSN